MDCMNNEMFIWIWFGLWSIGAKPAFINYNLTDRPLVHSIKTSTARVALVDEQVRSKYTEDVLNQFADVNFRKGKGFCEVVFMDNVLRKGIDEIQPMRFPDSDRGGQLLKDMAILIYTSGTTGLPKPAVVSWAKAGLAAMFVAEWLPIKTDDVMYTVSAVFSGMKDVQDANLE
jgi:acyl-CoA synthetase (AMP-forming)/AMP-acid ligase II